MKEKTIPIILVLVTMATISTFILSGEPPVSSSPSPSVKKKISLAADKKQELLTCKISSDKKVYRVGEVPKITIQIRNTTGREIYLIRAQDGSDFKMRYPYCYFEVQDAQGISAPAMMRKSGNVDELQPQSFIKVKPQELFVPRFWCRLNEFSTNPLMLKMRGWSAPYVKAGVYSVHFVYSSQSANPQDWAAGSQVTQLLQRVPKVTLKSNILKLTFIQNDKTRSVTTAP